MTINPFLGGTAIVAGLAAVWKKLMAFSSRITSLVVVRAELNEEVATAVLAHCWKNLKRSPFGSRKYNACSMFIRPLRRYQHVGYEQISREPVIFWHHGWPVLMGWDGSAPNESSHIKLTFLRGTFKLDDFIVSTLNQFNDRMATGTRQRFEVIRVAGSGSPMRQRGRNQEGVPSPGMAVESMTHITSGSVRLLRWNESELGVERCDNESAIDSMAFPKEVMSMVEEVRHWKLSEEWHREKQIPWRRGWLLHGKPGTGKTSLVRAIAQDLDLPVCTFDLATMSNDEMIQSWRKMLGHVPCVALMEDVDAVFSGRNNKLGDEGGGLSFDCLLNCISGIDTANGVFLVVTTNRVDELDDALGVPQGDGGTISTRPGRIDRALELQPLDKHCRLKLARRILADCPEFIEELVGQGTGDTGAQFQERCSQIALKYHWDLLKSAMVMGKDKAA